MNRQAVNEKIEAMREQVLDRALHEEHQTLEQAQARASAWRQEELAALERQAELILRNARTRAEEIRLRQTGAAEREKNREILRTRSRLVQDASRRFSEALARLRDREDYPALLRGLLDESMEGMRDVDTVHVLLAEPDLPLMESLLAFARERFPGVTFGAGREPAPIPGGLWLVSDDGKRQVNADWDTLARDLMPVLAERLAPLL